MFLHSETDTQHRVKQHTVKLTLSLPQMLTPSCPVSLVQCQCFLLALITISVTGDVSDS
ncbi:unnamed protein product [Staurois parvus]|uniref:Uncharacterized protein n=1 Tax=Staurois parvus TaxID=386267 RepID=A0ABN9CQ76_9NEOB|nr:unnamed protein product [Staurois parvus]